MSQYISLDDFVNISIQTIKKQNEIRKNLKEKKEYFMPEEFWEWMDKCPLNKNYIMCTDIDDNDKYTYTFDTPKGDYPYDKFD